MSVDKQKTQADASSAKTDASFGARVGRGVAWAILLAIMVVSVFPFLWAFRTAATTNPELLSGSVDLLPAEPTELNFKRVLGRANDAEILESSGRENAGQFDFLKALRNTIIIATAITVGQTLFSGMAAYAFARLEFKGREKLFLVYLSGLMIPPIFIFIPNLILMKDLAKWTESGWLNGSVLGWIPWEWLSFTEVQWLGTFKGIIMPFFFMTPFAVFFLRQFFLGINRSIEEAAFIDGAGHLRVFRSVVLPIAAPQMVTLAILTYVTSWNEYLWPLFVAGGNPDVQPLTTSLGTFLTQQPGTAPDWAAIMAATLLSALPVLALFAVFGRRLVDSIQFSGIK